MTQPTRTRREPRGEKSERRVESLLAVAREVFAAKGFASATTSEIAKRLGVSEATVFSYFGSKRELCIEVVRRWYDEITLALERDVEPILGTRARLHFVIRRHLFHLMGDGTGMCALVLSEGRVVDEAFASVITNLKRRYTAPMMRALEIARSTGELRSDVPIRLMRDMIYGSMEHVLWDYVATGRKPPLEATADHLTDLLLSAFTSQAAERGPLVRLQSDVQAALQRFERDVGSDGKNPP